MAAYQLTIKSVEGIDIKVVDENGIQYKDAESIPEGKYLRITHSILPGYDFISFSVTHGGVTNTYSQGDIVLIGYVSTSITINAVVSLSSVAYINGNSGFEKYQIFIFTEYGWQQFQPYMCLENGWNLCG